MVEVVYRVAPGGATPDGFVVALERRLEDGSVSTDGPAVAIFATEAEAQAEADRRNSPTSFSVGELAAMNGIEADGDLLAVAWPGSRF